MTKGQRITLMADWWPRACRAQGWNPNDRALRMQTLSEAVGRPLESANELNSTTDIDRVKAHLGMLADNVAATIETENPALGEARRLRWVIGETTGKLGKLLGGLERAQAYAAAIIRDKFNHGARLSPPLTVADLEVAQLRQLQITLARALAVKQKAARQSEPEAADQPF